LYSNTYFVCPVFWHWEEINDNCRLSAHTGAMDNGFIVCGKETVR